MYYQMLLWKLDLTKLTRIVPEQVKKYDAFDWIYTIWHSAIQSLATLLLPLPVCPALLP